MQTSFLFIKPHAVNDKVIKFVETRLQQDGYHIQASGNISAKHMSKNDLATKHYGTLAERAMFITPSKLPTPGQKALDSFQNEYGLSFQQAVSGKHLLNVSEYCATLANPVVDPFVLEKEWRT
jgi:hypothetical protein